MTGHYKNVLAAWHQHGGHLRVVLLLFRDLDVIGGFSSIYEVWCLWIGKPGVRPTLDGHRYASSFN